MNAVATTIAPFSLMKKAAFDERLSLTARAVYSSMWFLALDEVPLTKKNIKKFTPGLTKHLYEKVVTELSKFCYVEMAPCVRNEGRFTERSFLLVLNTEKQKKMTGREFLAQQKVRSSHRTQENGEWSDKCESKNISLQVTPHPGNQVVAPQDIVYPQVTPRPENRDAVSHNKIKQNLLTEHEKSLSNLEGHLPERRRKYEHVKELVEEGKRYQLKNISYERFEIVFNTVEQKCPVGYVSREDQLPMSKRLVDELYEAPRGFEDCWANAMDEEIQALVNAPGFVEKVPSYWLSNYSKTLRDAVSARFASRRTLADTRETTVNGVPISQVERKQHGYKSVCN